MAHFGAESINIANIKNAVRDSLAEFNLPPPKPRRNILLKEFGETCVSWYLENCDRLILIGLQWAETPLENRTGIDIIGITPQIDICYIEVKTRGTNKNIWSAIRGSDNSLVSELSDTRLMRYFWGHDGPYGIGSRIWIYRELSKLIREGRLNITLQTLEQKMVSTRKYIRYGAIVHPQGDDKLNQKIDRLIQRAFKDIDDECYLRENCQILNETDTCPSNCQLRNPIIFLDLPCEDFNNVFQNFIRVVRSLW